MTNQASTTPQPDGGSLRRIAILLVDDQKFVGMAVGRLLSTEPDIDLHCCLTASDAIPRAEEIRPAMILQDLVMPDVDGLTMVRRFRENPSTLHTPIIVLSGDDGPDAAARARSAGANDYLVKLPSKANLVACIRRHVANSRPPQPEVQTGLLDPYL